MQQCLRVRNPSSYAYPAGTGHPSTTNGGEKIVSAQVSLFFLSLSLSHTHTHIHTHTHTHWVDNPQKCDLWKHQTLRRIKRCCQHGARGVGQCLQDKMQRLCKISHSHIAQRACVIAQTHPHAHTLCLFNMARAQLTHTHTHTLNNNSHLSSVCSLPTSFHSFISIKALRSDRIVPL